MHLKVNKAKIVEAILWEKDVNKDILFKNQDMTSVRKDTLKIIEMSLSIIQVIMLIIENDFISHFHIKFLVSYGY